MRCQPVWRPAPPLFAALALSLALPLAPLTASPAAAQAPGLQLTVEKPGNASEVRGTIVIGGWAVDTASPTGTGSMSCTWNGSDSRICAMGARGTVRSRESTRWFPIPSTTSRERNFPTDHSSRSAAATVFGSTTSP